MGPVLTFEHVVAIIDRGDRVDITSQRMNFYPKTITTRTFATSEPAPPGERPGSIGFANAPIKWGGKHWAAYVWTFIPADERGRNELLMHEPFHRIQPELGLVTETASGSHLDTLEGRYWLQREWRALAQALRGRQRTRPGAARRARVPKSPPCAVSRR